jgi:hypothetical protein
MKRKRLLKFVVGLIIAAIVVGFGYNTVSATINTQKNKAVIERLNPPQETHESYTERGQAYSNLGEFQLAIVDFDYAMDLHPSECPNIFYFRAFAYANAGDYEQAVQDYTHSIQLNSSWYGAYFGRAYVYAKLNEYDLALDDINQAVKLEPDYHYGYYRRAWINRLRGDMEGAAADYIVSKIKWLQSQQPSPAPAHQATITFQPLVDEQAHITSQTPDGWQHIGENFYIPGSANTNGDMTQLGIQRADVNTQHWQEWLMDNFAQKGLDAPLVFAETITANDLTWNLYTSSFNGDPLYAAFAERGQETLMVLLLSTEGQTLYESVYLPTINETTFLQE